MTLKTIFQWEALSLSDLMEWVMFVTFNCSMMSKIQSFFLVWVFVLLKLASKCEKMQCLTTCGDEPTDQSMFTLQDGCIEAQLQHSSFLFNI